MSNFSGVAAYQRGVQSYAQVGVESGVVAASPHRLISLLFDGVQSRIRTAKLQMQQGNVAGKAEAISKAIDIVSAGLQSALDHEQGGELAANLEALYDYVVSRLLHANLHNDEDALDEAARLLDDIGSAWKSIAEQAPAAVGT